MPLDPNANCTVVIPTFRQPQYLRVAVKSIAEQLAPVRLLVSNDCSPDDTAQVIAELQREHDFEAVNHATNMGISAHLQWLLRQPQTKYIMRLDSDDFLLPGYVGELSRLLEENPQAGFAHCAIQEVDSEGRPRQERKLARKSGMQTADEALRRSVMGYQVSANVIMFRREALISVDFGSGSTSLNFVEDYDLSIRLAHQGWGNVYSSQTLACYRAWEGSSRPVVGRKLKEVRGLTHIFSNSLKNAFEDRGWPLEPLTKRRAELALLCSDVLDQGTFAPGEREEMIAALVKLSGSDKTPVAIGDGPLARPARLWMATRGKAMYTAKQGVKKLLFR